MNAKLFWWSSACAAAFSVGLSMNADAIGVTVFDPTNLEEWVSSLSTQAKQYYLQGQQAMTEATQLASFVRTPNLGRAMGLMNNAGLGSSLPVNPQAVASLVNSFSGGGIQGALGALSGFASTAYSKNHIYSPTDGSWNSQQMIANGNNIAGAQGAYQATYADLQTHLATYNSLRQHLTTLTTPKDVQDTQAQIALEQAWISNETAQMNAVQASFQTQQASAAQRDDETIAQSFDNLSQQASALPWN